MISTDLAVSKLTIHSKSSLLISVTLIARISRPLSTLEHHPLVPIRSTPGMLSSIHTECNLLSNTAVALMPDLLFLFSDRTSLRSPLHLVLSDSCAAMTFSTTFPLHLSIEINQYDLSFVLSSITDLQIMTTLGHLYTTG